MPKVGRPRKSEEDKMVAVVADIPVEHRDHLDTIVQYSKGSQTRSKIIREAIGEYLDRKKFIIHNKEG